MAETRNLGVRGPEHLHSLCQPRHLSFIAEKQIWLFPLQTECDEALVLPQAFLVLKTGEARGTAMAGSLADIHVHCLED